MAGPVRQPIDVPALERYIEGNVKEIKPPLELKQFGFGQSNPTYQLIDSTGAKYVMRKKPPGKLLSKTAHNVVREHKIISALAAKTDLPVPQTYCLCEDDSIIGSSFYIMEMVDGRHITEPDLPGVSAEERKEMWHDAIRVLGRFHKVKPREVGLGDFGRFGGFYDRQLKTLGTISKDQAATKDVETDKEVGAIPHFDQMVDFFKQKSSQPKDRATLVHGDYKIDNLIFHKTEPRVIGILDWEMATIGHPLSDIVNLTGPYWSGKTGKNPNTGELIEKDNFAPGATPGLPTIEECMRWYAEASGYDPGIELEWGNAFGGYRGGVIMQGIAARYAQRQASGLTAKNYGAQMGPYGEYTWSMIVKLKDKLSGQSKL